MTMGGHECFHCKQWVEEGEAHDCWTTTEAALTSDLSEDLRDAWERLRDTAAEFGEQRIYASHHCIMFSRTACYCFVRPKKSALEVVFFLGRAIQAPQIRRVERPSQKKFAHIVRVTHRDEVEAPLTDWLLEAFNVSDQLSGRGGTKAPAAAAATRSAKGTKRPVAGAKGTTRTARAAKRAAKTARRAKRVRAAKPETRNPTPESRTPKAKS
jgi:hypothetical protein